jgi:hypothetical protein
LTIKSTSHTNPGPIRPLDKRLDFSGPADRSASSFTSLPFRRGPIRLKAFRGRRRYFSLRLLVRHPDIPKNIQMPLCMPVNIQLSKISIASAISGSRALPESGRLLI